MQNPTLAYEKELWQAGKTRLVGLDEVGRGALCACVVAAAVILPSSITEAELEGVRDSKLLSAAQREKLVTLIEQKALAFGIGAASPAEIDRLNIYGATILAMRRALARVGDYDHLLIDGKPIKAFGREKQTAIVKGDRHSLSIACASVLAKVCRDKLLHNLAQIYPAYGWAHNVGYPTAEHKAALELHGATKHHRRSYKPVRETISPETQSQVEEEIK